MTLKITYFSNVELHKVLYYHVSRWHYDNDKLMINHSEGVSIYVNVTLLSINAEVE